MKKKTMASIKPTTVSIQAMWTAVPAMPEKPNTAAISAMMKNVIAHEIIWSSSFKLSPKTWRTIFSTSLVLQPSADPASCGRTEPTNRREIRNLHTPRRDHRMIEPNDQPSSLR